MNLRTGDAYWPLANGLLRSYPALDHDETADVVVVGAGITGALVAYRLASAGANVVVVDRRDVASGSTAATTGLLLYETDTMLLDLSTAIGAAGAVRAWQLGAEAITSVERLCDALGDRCGFSRCKSLYLASSSGDVALLRAEQEYRTQAGFCAEWLSSRELETHYGVQAPAGIRSIGGGQVDAFRLTHALLSRSTVALGARVFDRTTVTSVDTVPDGGVVVHTDRQSTISARQLVWCTGYEAVEDFQKRHVQMHSTWVLVSEPVAASEGWGDIGLIWETARPYLYARRTDDGRIMLGGEDRRFSWRHSSQRLMRTNTDRLVARFRSIQPATDIEIAYRWAGVFTSTSDGLPFIGRLDGDPSVWLALGYGGNGITFSAIAADLICADWRGSPSADAALFDCRRTPS